MATMYRHGCRCDLCRSWQRDEYRKSKVLAGEMLISGEIKHGTSRAYGHAGCRCSLCLEWRKGQASKLANAGNRDVRQNQWKLHGIKNGVNKFTYKDYENLWIQQGGICIVCGCAIQTQKNEGGNAAAVDHDHNTGKVRGLLCTKCNMGIGLFKEDSGLLRKAANYLEKSTSFSLE